MYPVRRQISTHAAQLRRERTEAEQRFWLEVRDRRLDGWKFRFQMTGGPFVADFACIAAKLVIELDGGQHTVERDAARTAFLEARGFRVLRFWNDEVFENLEGVLLTVLEALNASRAVRK